MAWVQTPDSAVTAVAPGVNTPSTLSGQTR